MFIPPFNQYLYSSGLTPANQAIAGLRCALQLSECLMPDQLAIEAKISNSPAFAFLGGTLL